MSEASKRKERKPELRFKGFDEEWGEKRLGNLVKLNGRIGFRGYTEKDIISKDEGGVLTFSPTNIVENKLTLSCKNTYITRAKYDESPEIKINNGDILFVKTGSTLGKSALVIGLSEDATLNPQVIVMRTHRDITEFIAYSLITDVILEQVNCTKIGGAVPTLTETKIKDFHIYLPSLDAQQKIGTYFQNLDNIITHQQHKYGQLQNLKKAMLEKMFPRNGADVPEIRFKGFEGAWDVVELGKLTVEVVRKAPEESAAPIMMISAASGFINQSEKYSTDNAGSSLKNYTLLKKGELSYNHGYSKLRNYGSCFELREEEARVPFVYHSFSLPEDDATFYSQYLNSGIFDKELKKRVSSTARMDGLLNISYESYMTLNVGHPCFEEQKKIANYFQNLDALISHQQKKLEHVKHLKSALLEKMFVSEKAA